MSDWDHEDPPEPTEEEHAAMAVKVTLTKRTIPTGTRITATVDHTELEQNLINSVVQNVVHAEIKKHFDQRVTPVIEEIVHDVVTPHIGKILEDGWTKTDQWGRNPTPVKLSDLVREVVMKQDGYSRGAWIDELIKKHVEHTISTELNGIIKDAKAAFKKRVDELLNAAIADGLRKTFGLGD